MIGEPMTFVHLTHTGSGDGFSMTGAIQEQMRSKGNRDRGRGRQLPISISPFGL
uniref:CDC42 small effector protein 1 n=1 Tax=Sarcophilus harrisii TaxID=9305 RepID=A0A7N4PNK0_SARHA